MANVRSRSVLIAVALAASSVPVFAADLWWGGGIDPTWSTLISPPSKTNFTIDALGLLTSSNLPSAVDTVRLSASNATRRDTVLGRDFTIDSLITESNLGGDFTISSGSSTQTLTVGAVGGGIVTNAPRTLTINCNLSSIGNTSFNTANASSVVVVNSAIAGPFGLTKSGPGTLTLANNNTYLGTTTVNGGTLRIGNGGTGGSITGDLVNNAAVIFNRSNDSTYSGSVSGTGSLTKTGSGTLTLTTGAAITNPITISQGTLQLGNNSPVASINVPIVNNGALTISNTGYTFVNQPISGSGAVTFTGSGGHALTANNTYTGLSTVNGAVLQLGTGGTTGSVAGNIALVNGTVSFARSDDITYAGAITGNGQAAKFGSNTLTVTGSVGFSGQFQVGDGGTLQIGSGGTSGFISTNSIAFFNSSNLTFNRSDNISYSGVISGSGSLTKTGAGVLTLSGANSYTLGTRIVQGAIASGATNAIGPNATLILGQSSAAGTPQFSTQGFDQTLVTLSIFARSSGGTAISVGNGTLTLQTNVTLLDTQDSPGNQFGATISSLTLGKIDLGGGVRTFTLAGQNVNQQELIVQPVITNGGLILNASPSTFNGATAGMVLAANGPNTYAGGTTVNAGLLTVNSTTTLGPGPLTISTTAGISSQVTLNSNQTIGSLGTGSVGSVVPKLTLNGTTAVNVSQSTSATFAGIIEGTGSLTKTGGSTLTLTAANTYSGGTSVLQGALQLGNGGTSGSVTGNILNNANLIFNRSDNISIGSIISGTGVLTKTGSGALNLSGVNTYAGGTVLLQGNLTTSVANALPFGAPLTIGQFTGTTGLPQVGLGGFDQTLSGLTIYARNNAGTCIQIANGTLTLTGDVALLDTQTSAGNLFGTTIGASTLGSLSLGNGTRTFTIAGQNVGQQELILQTVVTNGGIILQANPSSTVGNAAGMVLGAFSPNTYAGGTTVSAGVLTVLSSTTLGPGSLTLNTTGAVASAVVLNSPQTVSSLASGSVGSVAPTVTLNVGTNFTVSQTTNTTFAGIIDGVGSFTKSDFGTLTFSGANTYAGGTTIKGGTLQLGNGGTTGSIVGNVVNNGTLAFNRSDTVTFTGNITGAGLLSKRGTGTVVLTGPGTLTNSLSVQSGVLKLASTTAIVSILPAIAISNDGAPLGSRTYLGQLDVTSNDLIVRNGSLADLSDMARAGQAGDGVNLFSGNGITSSTAAADANGLLRYAVGVMPNSFGGVAIYDTFDGISVGQTDVLVKFTYFGDADLSGLVDDTDYFLINAGYLNTLTGWLNGDFDYSGVVDDTDFFLINNGFRNQGTALRTGSGVPEPTGMGLIALPGGGLLGRRRRR